MSKSKNTDLTKHTLNLRTGDMEKMGELFPNERPSVALRLLVSGFVDKYYDEPTAAVPIITDL